MVLNEDSVYHGGYFRAQMTFPADFPYAPPKFKFTPPIFHPNVYRDGRLCISILHPGGDVMSGEPDQECWSPVQSVESVLISIVSLLEDPNINSPANPDASVMWKKDKEEYRTKVLQDVKLSREHIPEGFVVPSSSSAYVAPKAPEHKDVVDDNFWYESDDASMVDDESIDESEVYSDEDEDDEDEDDDDE
ncbi:Ubiquitin-conjugating enzyme E2-34 kDa [Yarrowia sp. B02]|nr:Ubiquitin-conjugating enzyme E2-34 kDa [Yarrowia sp. B02]